MVEGYVIVVITVFSAVVLLAFIAQLPKLCGRENNATVGDIAGDNV